MDLYLIRHADALPMGNGITSDAERPLSGVGEDQARAVAAAFQGHNIALEKLLFSPLVRARQTAEIIAKRSEPAPELQSCEHLAPGGKAKKLARSLAALGCQRIGLVGHMPDMGDLAGWFIGSKKAQIDFAKAGIAYIVLGDNPDKGLGSLAWLVTREWFDLSPKR